MADAQRPLARRVANTLRARPSLNAETAIAILVRVANASEDTPWDLGSVVPPCDRERAVQIAQRRGLQVRTQRAADVE